MMAALPHLLAVLLTLMVAPTEPCACPFTDGGHETQWMTAKQFASQAYGRWRAENPGRQCPAALADLTRYMNLTDIWAYRHWSGQDLYTMYCGPEAANIPGGFGVAHVGDDGRANTADDIKSWEWRRL